VVVLGITRPPHATDRTSLKKNVLEKISSYLATLLNMLDFEALA